MSGSGYRMVRPSWVAMKGTPPLPNWHLFTLHSLYVASSLLMRWGTKRPLVSYSSLQHARNSLRCAGLEPLGEAGQCPQVE